MRITLIQVDKTQDRYLEEGIEKFLKRLAGYVRVDVVTIHVPKAVRQRSVEEQKTEEAKLVLEKTDARDHLVLLDDKGKQFSSEEFAQYISAKQNTSLKSLVFVIGGPFGFGKPVLERANEKLSLSRMTFSHQMIRLLFVEQLYRAYTIIKGEKYHHE